MMSGVKEPWNDVNVKVRVAGDDVVVLCAP